MLPLLFSLFSLTASADDYSTGQAVALGGFGLGVAGNLTSIGATLALVPYVDVDTGEIPVADARRVEPVHLIGGSVRRAGGALMGLGTLQMYGANRRAGAEYGNTCGTLSLALGLGSLAAFGAAEALTWPAESNASAQLASGAVLGLASTGMIVASFTLGFTQYVMNNANKPAKRRKIDDARFQLFLVPADRGVALAGVF
ncbi:MAG: hypothetical protein R3F61_19045 [Myxococcota bacterium]